MFFSQSGESSHNCFSQLLRIVSLYLTVTFFHRVLSLNLRILMFFFYHRIKYKKDHWDFYLTMLPFPCNSKFMPPNLDFSPQNCEMFTNRKLAVARTKSQLCDKKLQLLVLFFYLVEETGFRDSPLLPVTQKTKNVIKMK